MLRMNSVHHAGIAQDEARASACQKAAADVRLTTIRVGFEQVYFFDDHLGNAGEMAKYGFNGREVRCPNTRNPHSFMPVSSSKSRLVRSPAHRGTR